MIFKPLLFFKNEQMGTDELNNPIYELIPSSESEGRFSSWTAEEIALDKREATVNNRKIVTRAPLPVIKAADRVKFEDQFHDIREIKGDDLTRWRILIVNRYGSAEL